MNYSLESGYGMEELNADRSKPAAVADSQTGKPDGDFLFGKDGLTFSDVLATINPLQHIPIVATIYREITGDVIKPIARIAGDALYGGPIGALAGAINSAAEYALGGDVGHTLIALVRDGKLPDSPGDTVLAQAPAKDGEAAGEDAPTQIATAPIAKIEAAPLDAAAAPAAQETQLAAIPHARLVSRSGNAEALGGQVAEAPQPVAPAAPATQLAQASTPAAPLSSPTGLTIGQAAAADEAQSRSTQGGLGRGGVGLAGFGVRSPASALAAETVPVTASGDQTSAVDSLARLSATGLSRNGLPTAGAATPASVIVEAQNAVGPGGDPSQAFGNSGLRPPRINNIAPRMPATYQAQNHTAVALPPRGASARPLQEPMAPVEAAVQPSSANDASANAGPAVQLAEQTAAAPAVVAPAAIPDTMAKALDKYEALMKSRRGSGVNQSY
jgi:hypothetical protein